MFDALAARMLRRHEPIRELEIELAPGREVEDFLDRLKGHFSSHSRRTAEQTRAKQQQLLQQLGQDANKIDPEMLATATDMQMVRVPRSILPQT